MQLKMRNKAPQLTEERLEQARNHSFEHIRKLTAYVDEAKRVKGIPSVLPSLQYINGVQAQCHDLSGEEQTVAFHIIWYVKELLLGRYPN